MEPIGEFYVPAYGIKIKVEADTERTLSRILPKYEPNFMDAVRELFEWVPGFDSWQMKKEFNPGFPLSISGQKMNGVMQRAIDRKHQ